MIKNLIQNFLPWILYSILMGHSQERIDIAVIAAAISSVAFELDGLKQGYVLSWGTLIFFVGMVFAVVVFKNQWIINYEWIFSNGTLALIAFISVIIKKPFTIQYAKKIVPEDQWQSPLFVKINYMLSIFWGMIFLLDLQLHVMRTYFNEFHFYNWFYQVLSYGIYVFAAWFTAWFPDWYKERYIRSINSHAK